MAIFQFPVCCLVVAVEITQCERKLVARLPVGVKPQGRSEENVSHTIVSAVQLQPLDRLDMGDARSDLEVGQSALSGDS